MYEGSVGPKSGKGGGPGWGLVGQEFEGGWGCDTVVAQPCLIRWLCSIAFAYNRSFWGPYRGPPRFYLWNIFIYSWSYEGIVVPATPSQRRERACRAPTGARSAGDQKRRPSGRLFRVSSDGVAPPRSSFLLPAFKADSAAPPPAAPYSTASPNGGRLGPSSRSNSAAASTMFVPGPKIATVPTDFRKS